MLDSFEKLTSNLRKLKFGWIVINLHSLKRKTKDLIPLKFGKENIKRAKYVKLLRVLVDEHLSWKYHICELRKKLSRRNGLLFKLGRWLPIATLICLYTSLVSPFLNYGIIVWGRSFDTHVAPIFLLQKKILRCINFYFPTVTSTPLFHSSKIPKLEDVFYLNLLIFVYKAMNKISPIYFHDYVPRFIDFELNRPLEETWSFP